MLEINTHSLTQSNVMRECTAVCHSYKMVAAVTAELLFVNSSLLTQYIC